jgi:DNA mismatch repair protein MutS2
MEQERARLREKMSANEKNMGLKAARKPSKELTAKDLRIGDSVRVLSMNLKGTVSTKPDARGNLYVQMGILRSQVNISDLELIPENSVSGPGLDSRRKGSGSSNIKMSKSASVSPEINLLGMTVDEAVSVLDKYLDDALIAHLGQVRVVHGKGTGALRAGIHKHLKKLKTVKEFHLAEFGEGDAGVTIVVFK